MAFNQISLDNLSFQIGNSLDDQREIYWTRLEKYYAITEALRVWGAYTSYWRTRGSFNLTPNVPYYDLSSKLPLLRPRTVTLQDMVQEIQYHCLEAPNGISGLNMSGQVQVSSIITAIARARNRFVIDSCLPLELIASSMGPPTPEGLCSVDEDIVYIHRAGWQDAFSQKWSNLWRQDEWAYDKTDPTWMTDPGEPQSFSEALNSPLNLQIYPPPNNQGNLELIAAKSITMDINNPASPLNFPDEWCHGIKYAALNDIFDSGMIFDPVRAEYCETRYQQAVSGITNIKTVNRLIIGNNQVPIDSYAALDAGDIYWRNRYGSPETCGVMNDFLVIAPLPDKSYGASVDLVQSAPIPATGDAFIQIGQEELANLIDYCVNYLTLKCGGKNLQDTFGNYDSFMTKVDQRKANNDVKIMYLNALTNQPMKEEIDRPTKNKPKRKDK